MNGRPSSLVHLFNGRLFASNLLKVFFKICTCELYSQTHGSVKTMGFLKIEEHLHAAQPLHTRPLDYYAKARRLDPAL